MCNYHNDKTIFINKGYQMKKYTLLITIGSLFLGTTLPAMDSSNIDRYKSFLSNRLIAPANMYNTTLNAFAFNRRLLNDKTRELKDYATNFKINHKTAIDLITDAIIDGWIYHASGHVTDPNLTDKFYLKNNFEKQIKNYVENAFVNN